jgi:phosphatidylglycerophosphate synthase
MMDVSLLAWLLCIVLPLVVLAYATLFELPFINQRKTRVSHIKDVSHGISMQTERAVVYDDWYTEANLITCVGFYELGAMVVLIFLHSNLILEPFMFLIVVLSDLLDGYVASKRQRHSELGAKIDAVRDRLTIPLVLMSIYTAQGFGLWLAPAGVIGLFEGTIAYTALRAQSECSRPLNTHGPGMLRQIVHLLMVESILIVSYMIQLPAGYSGLVTIFALCVMAIASYFATVNYVNQFTVMLGLTIRSSKTNFTFHTE